MKYNLTFNSGLDPFTNVFVMVNDAGSGLLVYAILFLVFSVLSWVYMRRTQDTGKSLASSVFATSIIGLIFYYWGKFIGETFINEVLFYGLFVTLAISITGLWFFRMNKD